MSPRPPCYLTGPDLGPPQGFTVLAVPERPAVSGEDVLAPRRPIYALRHLRRFPLGTPYPTVMQTVVSLLGATCLSDPTLVGDHTGVGHAVVAESDCEIDQANYCVFRVALSDGQRRRPQGWRTTLSR